ncbi:MAG TPA: hypothetical protein PLZ95_03145 [Bryobacteraceae bacterium]|nr:hypothetical protein [Bryobacteraceae bacterium]
MRKLSADRIMKAAGIAEGAALPKSRSGLEEALVAMDGVAVAHVEAFCCEQGEPILYVGILERGTPLFEYRPEPDGEVSLSEEDAGAYAGFAAALGRATSEDDLAEDLTAGHSMMRNPDCRAYQLRFAEIAEQRLENVQAVLARAADPEQRAAAAYIIGYAVNKRVVVGDLQAALRDASPSVRLNATSALRAIAVLGRDKSLGISIPATWFVEMLNSVVLADRLAGSRTLNLMYDEFSEGTMAQIKERALSSLFEMARWRHLQHALPAYLLLGRVSGVAEQEMAAAWEASERDQMLARIEKLLKPVTAKKK